MDDLISRAAVKSAFIEYRDKMKVLTPFEINRLVDLFAIIKDLEAVDALPVVRCKDCKHRYFADNRVLSEQTWVCEKDGLEKRPDWYCADGERRDEYVDGTTR